MKIAALGLSLVLGVAACRFLASPQMTATSLLLSLVVCGAACYFFSRLHQQQKPDSLAKFGLLVLTSASQFGVFFFLIHLCITAAPIWLS